MKSQDIHSIAVVPLYDDYRVLGFYGIDNPPKQNLEEPFESDFQKLMSAAEQLMYQEKNEYYRAAGIDRRR